MTTIFLFYKVLGLNYKIENSQNFQIIWKDYGYIYFFFNGNG